MAPGQTPFGAEVTTEIIGESGASAENLCARGVDEELLKNLGFSGGCGTAGGAVTPACSCDCQRRSQEAMVASFRDAPAQVRLMMLESYR
jgi:hypothetical protein